jgi:hypothetical protein
MIGAGQRHAWHLSAAAEAMSWMLTESGHRTKGPWLSKLDAPVTGAPAVDAIVLRQRAAGMITADRLSHELGMLSRAAPPPPLPEQGSGLSALVARSRCPLVLQVAWAPVTAAVSVGSQIR